MSKRGAGLFDLVGWRSGRLVVVDRHPENSSWNQPQWICNCDCGGFNIVTGQALRQRRSRSCGCLTPGDYFQQNGRVPLTQSRLKEIIDYNPESGEFRWRITMGGRALEGQVAGVVGLRGHRSIRVDGRSYPAGRLAWFYVHGEFPKHLIDHINGNRVDDRIVNLRPATHSENGRNSSGHSASGLKGAYFNKPTKTWFSTIRIDGKHRRLGTFPSKEEAHAAYVRVAKEIYGEFATTRMRDPSAVKWEKLRKEIIERDGFKCTYCGSGDDLAVDHVISRSRGGTDDPSNLVTACISCNAKKHNRTLEDFMRSAA